MANAIAVSKRDIGGIREFSRFEGFHYIAASPGPAFRAEKCL